MGSIKEYVNWLLWAFELSCSIGGVWTRFSGAWQMFGLSVGPYVFVLLGCLGLGLLCAWNHDRIMLWFPSNRFRASHSEIAACLTAVTHVYRPGVLNPARPGNPVAIREIAESKVRALAVKLRRLEILVNPSLNFTDPDWSCGWYKFLHELVPLAEIGAIKQARTLKL